MIDKGGLIEKLKQTIARLEQTLIEIRRALYSNLIEFAEIHPTKIRVGVLAPTIPNPNQMKATGTEGRDPSRSLRMTGIKGFEPGKSNIVRRAGSTSVTIGARRFILEEPLVWAQTYPIQWREPRFDLAELAKRRRNKGADS